MKVKIKEDVLAELEYMVRLHKEHGAPAEFDSVERLVGYVLRSIADGSRRPGSWERQILEMMGIATDCIEHNTYRATYGKPEDVQ